VQLDRTEIVIRQRTALELFDLSLLVFHRHYKPMLLTCAILGVPLLALDVFALHWMLSEDSLLVAEDLPSPIVAMRLRYVSHLILLFVMQFPIISLPATVFLGNQIFYESISIASLLRRIAPIALRSLVILGIVRLGLVGLVLEFVVARGEVFDWSTEIWILFVIAGIGLLLRATGPFAPEILGLELCPLRASQGKEITYAQRSRSLHKQLVAEHILRFVGSLIFGVLIALMLLGTMLFLQGNLTANWQWNGWYDFVLLPFAMWLVGTYMAVFRFLSYLDSRIRLEGWEIELRLRAEAERLGTSHRVGTSTTTITTEPVAS
jgi:hypothetical protein